MASIAFTPQVQENLCDQIEFSPLQVKAQILVQQLIESHRRAMHVDPLTCKNGRTTACFFEADGQMLNQAKWMEDHKTLKTIGKTAQKNPLQ